MSQRVPIGIDHQRADPDTVCPYCGQPITVRGADRYGVLTYHGGCCHVTGVSRDGVAWEVGFADS